MRASEFAAKRIHRLGNRATEAGELKDAETFPELRMAAGERQ